MECQRYPPPLPRGIIADMTPGVEISSGRMRGLWLVAIAALVLAGCRQTSLATETPTASAPSAATTAGTVPTPVGVASATPTLGARGGSTPTTATSSPPSISHIFLIVMENKEYGDIIGSAAAPYLNQLAGQYALAERYYGIRHPSLPNYLALLGGDTFGITSDCTNCFVNKPNLVDALEAKGKTWRAYEEDLPSPCYLGASSGGYALKHDPFLYFDDIRNNPGRCQNVVPLTQLDTDLSTGAVPDFVWITPNLRHDMHDASVSTGDAWLASFVPRILASEAWRNDGLLMIVWDEGSTNAGCCGVASGGHIPALFISPAGKPGYRITEPATHYSVLRTIEDLWGLERLGHSTDPSVTPLLDFLR